MSTYKCNGCGTHIPEAMGLKNILDHLAACGAVAIYPNNAINNLQVWIDNGNNTVSQLGDNRIAEVHVVNVPHGLPEHVPHSFTIGENAFSNHWKSNVKLPAGVTPEEYLGEPKVSSLCATCGKLLQQGNVYYTNSPCEMKAVTASFGNECPFGLKL